VLHAATLPITTSSLLVRSDDLRFCYSPFGNRKHPMTRLASPPIT
jgi:hypothetical protein